MANDVCATATALTLGQAVNGDITHANNDYNLASGATCPVHTAPGPDVVYSFTPSASGPYVITATPTGASGSGFDAVLYVLSSCPATGGTSLSACVNGADSGGSGVAEHVKATLTAGTTYFIVVDSYWSTDTGPFSVQVDSAPPPPANDTCATATALTLGQAVSGDLTSAINDYNLTSGAACPVHTAPGPDVVYTFTPSASGSYVITATPTGTSGSTFDPVLYVLDSCPATGGTSLNACVKGVDNGGQGVPEDLVLTLNAGVTYYIVVDGYNSSSAGPFSVQIASAPPPPANDVCSGATPLTLSAFPDGGQGASASFDTAFANNDSTSDPNGMCFGDGAGNDVVYKVTLAAPVSSLTATMTPTPADGGTFYPVVYIRNSPCFDAYPADGGPGPAAELACDDPFSGSATARTGPLDGGDYFIWVDSSGGRSKGPGTLEVTVP